MSLNLGVRIKQARQHAQMTQTELAKALGLNRSAVAQWEGHRKIGPTTHHLAQVAQATRVRFEWLATGRGSMQLHDEDVANAVTLNSFAQDNMEEALLQWFRSIPMKARMAFIEHQHAINPPAKTRHSILVRRRA